MCHVPYEDILIAFSNKSELQKNINFYKMQRGENPVNFMIEMLRVLQFDVNINI